MRSEPARLGGISLDFVGIPPRWDENFPYEQAQASRPARQGGVECSLKVYQCKFENIPICSRSYKNNTPKVSRS